MRRKIRRKGGSSPLAVAAVLLGLSVFFLMAGKMHERAEVRRVISGHPGETRTVIIDPGHGGEDGGAVGVDGAIEKDINLAVSLKLRDLLTVQGYEVLMTRENDHMTCGDDVKGIGRRKKADMRNRLRLIDEHPEAVVLSIHQNLFEKESCCGAQMFYGRKHPFSRVLAQSIQGAFVRNLQPGNLREIKEGGKGLFLLWQSESPIVLVECGFLSNREECSLLQQEEYQKKTAFTIMEGLMEALSEEMVS